MQIFCSCSRIQVWLYRNSVAAEESFFGYKLQKHFFILKISRALSKPKIFLSPTWNLRRPPAARGRHNNKEAWLMGSFSFVFSLELSPYRALWCLILMSSVSVKNLSRCSSRSLLSSEFYFGIKLEDLYPHVQHALVDNRLDGSCSVDWRWCL